VRLRQHPCAGVSLCRKALLEFIKLLDLDYERCFTCPVCLELPHDELVLIIDGKEMGMNRALVKLYIAPSSLAYTIVPLQW
jgi:hypothetical protein